ncbi:dihydrofolate reductase [Lentibacillus salicampi]|uniref:Dihydrofolate reductase n=1 Tax=Lentibacillus salicampi TaxID=175306 RepID=A0A4Y9ADH8_9BACI|nr:dihydrofolate reductase [Lentibacillus salicampi]TFJ93853.1 dihydrofolate reductase [Lentibacillus salicampi]
MISLLVAMDRNHVIGHQNDLPWHLPNDLKFFKKKTTGHTIIMGRKTFVSIGKPLPNRRNVVISKQRSDSEFPDGMDVIHDIGTIIDWNHQEPAKELFVIGGEEIFKQVLPHADRMYITLIDDAFQGDTYFPDFSEIEWQLSAREKGEKDGENPYDYFFLQYDRQVRK